MFSLTDKVLIDRAARLIKEQAQELLNAACPPGGWGATEASRKAKLVYDRLVRDERDMRALGKRLCAHFDVKPDRAKPESVSREAQGNPQLPLTTSDDKVEYLPAPVGEEVHDG